jgi:rare lipoprotein A
MRPMLDPRAGRAFAAVAALGLTYATGAVATRATAAAATPPTAAPAAPADPTTQLSSTRVRFGQRVFAHGVLPGAQRGIPVLLEYRAPQQSSWELLARAITRRGGRFTLHAPLTRSGLVRVTVESLTAPTQSLRALTAPGEQGDGVFVTVLPDLGVGHRNLDVHDGQRASVAGTVRPAVAGERVVLQLDDARGWRTVAHGRTGPRGRYRLAFPSGPVGTRRARLILSAPGEAPTVQPIGRENTYRPAGASYYDLGGTTACGGQLDAGTLGVANKTLPCGTLVTLRYGSRSVTVPVIDRGPYVAGRDYDLTVATKDALGFPSTGIVWATS